MLVGILTTTIGISLLTLGLVGASIQVYSQLLTAVVEQQVSAVTEQLPSVLQPEAAPSAAGSGSPLDPANVLRSLLENLLNNPLWLVICLTGIALIYLGLYISHRQRLGYRP